MTLPPRDMHRKPHRALDVLSTWMPVEYMEHSFFKILHFAMSGILPYISVSVELMYHPA